MAEIADRFDAKGNGCLMQSFLLQTPDFCRHCRHLQRMGRKKWQWLHPAYRWLGDEEDHDDKETNENTNTVKTPTLPEIPYIQYTYFSYFILWTWQCSYFLPDLFLSILRLNTLLHFLCPIELIIFPALDSTCVPSWRSLQEYAFHKRQLISVWFQEEEIKAACQSKDESSQKRALSATPVSMFHGFCWYRQWRNLPKYLHLRLRCKRVELHKLN